MMEAPPVSSVPMSVSAPDGGASAPANAASAAVNVDIPKLLACLNDNQPEVVQSAIDALELCRRDAAPNPLVLMGLGIVRAKEDKADEALALFEAALALDKKCVPVWLNLGNFHKLQGRPEAAREAFAQVLALQPGLAEAHYGIGVIESDAEQLDAAEKHLRRALLFRPDYPAAHNNLGHVLVRRGKVEQAISHFKQALAWDASFRPARLNLVMALLRLARNTEAQAEVDRLLAENPHDQEVLRAQAAGLMQQGRIEDAENVNTRLAEIDPAAVDVALNSAEVLLARRDFDGALALYKDLLRYKGLPPVVALGAMANVWLAQGNYSAAREIYQQALMLDARPSVLTLGLARTLLGAGDTVGALSCLRQAVKLLPQAAEVHSLLIHGLLLAGDDAGRAAEIARWIAQHGAPVPTREESSWRLPQGAGATTEKTIRVGFLFGDLEHDPVVAGFSAFVQALVDAGVSCLAYHVGGTLGKGGIALQATFSHWRPVAGLGNTDIVEQMRADALDMLIDMIGHGPGSRLQSLADKPATLQYVWLGEFAHPGLAQVDSLVGTWDLLADDDTGDALILPALLPWRPVSELAAEPLEALPGVSLVIGVIAPLALIGEECLDAWSEIMAALPEARLLWLTDSAEADEATRERWRRLMSLREIEPERVEMLAWCDARTRFALLTRMSLVLDTLPTSMGLPTLEALWAGTPVLTLAGERSWQRSCASILHSVGGAEWVANSREQYVAKAIEMVSQPVVARGRVALRERLLASPLMDIPGLAAAFARCVAERVKQRREDRGAVS